MAAVPPIVMSLTPQQLVRELLVRLGEDPDRDGLKETPDRVWRALKELTSGLDDASPAEDLLKAFDNKDGSREMVVVRDIDFTSLCEHHLLPFEGVAHVAYLPGDKIVGLSKFGRLVDRFARRPQVQERLTDQIARTVWEVTKSERSDYEDGGPVSNMGGAACVVEAHHSCMSCRGVRKQKASMVTSALYGAFKDDAKTRSEFLALIHGRR